MKDLGSVTCNCGVINGGTVPNTVAKSCTFYADIRFLTEEDEIKARKIVEKIVNENKIEGCLSQAEEISYRPSMPYTEKNNELLNKMNEIYLKNQMTKLNPSMAYGGSDAAYATKHGIPCVDNLGVTGGFIHSENEFMYLDSICESAKRMAIIAMCI